MSKEIIFLKVDPSNGAVNELNLSNISLAQKRQKNKKEKKIGSKIEEIQTRNIQKCKLSQKLQGVEVRQNRSAGRLVSSRSLVLQNISR